MPTVLRAQTTEEVLAARQLEYRAAVAQHEAARSAFEVVDRQLSVALSELTQVRRGGDQNAVARAFAIAQERSRPVRDQGLRVREAGEVVEEARRALIEMLTVRLTELLSRMTLATGAEAARLDAIWRDHNNQLEALESEAEDPFRLDPVVLGEITFDQRDTPEDREDKARLLERMAAMADTAIQVYDRQIEGLQDRLRQERSYQDFLARTRRFGDTPPVVPTRPVGDPPAQATDSTGAPVPSATLEERIELLRTDRENLLMYRDQLLIRAEQFRHNPRVWA